MNDSTFITRVMLRNYKSIANCDVKLGPLTFLVGQNGSGKSNFLNALRFVAESLNSTMDLALRDRGGIKSVRRHSTGHPTHFAVRLEFRLHDGTQGHYAFQVGAKAAAGYEVQKEECRIVTPAALEPSPHYSVEGGKVVNSSIKDPPAAASDRLYLVSVSGRPEFRLLYDLLSRMGFYNLNPEQIREPQSPDEGRLLLRDGSNLASVLGRLQSQGQVRERLEAFLAKVVPGVKGVERRQWGAKETLEFIQEVEGSRNPWRFPALNMSDGTLRALGILAALFQGLSDPARRVPLVGIEEPEAALHPAAAGVLRDALVEASSQVQVLVTSHSPDLLDDKEVRADQLLAVRSRHGVTQIAPTDEAGRSAIRDRLYTPGELLRMNQLEPDPDELRRARAGQGELFGEDGP